MKERCSTKPNPKTTTPKCKIKLFPGLAKSFMLTTHSCPSLVPIKWQRRSAPNYLHTPLDPTASSRQQHISFASNRTDIKPSIFWLCIISAQQYEIL